MCESDVNVVHQGRGGYVEYEACRYSIGLEQEGHFCIFSPCAHRHGNMQAHLDRLKVFAALREPSWYVDNRSRKYTSFM